MRTLLLITTALALTACSIKDNASAIDQVEAMINNNDYNRALELCNKIISDSANSDISASLWGQLSIRYMQLAEMKHEDENTAIALQCYRQAFATDSDSAALFYENIDINLTTHIHTLRMLSSSLDITPEFLEFETPDSFYIQ